MADVFDMKKRPEFAAFPKQIITIAVAIVLFMLLASSFQVVGAGERGVLFSKLSGVKDIQLGEGLHWKLPFFEEIVTIDVKVQKSQTDARAASKDLQNVSSTIAVNFHIDPSRAH
jgi:regulator of protease activity HflC (stomatin/prohibitin superfamily)